MGGSVRALLESFDQCIVQAGRVRPHARRNIVCESLQHVEMDFNAPSSLRRAGRSYSEQALSPTSDYMTQSAISALSIDDPAAALLDRWQSVYAQLTSSSLSSSAVIALNRTLDHAEHVARGATTAVHLEPVSQRIGLGISKIDGERPGSKAVVPATPPHSIRGSPKHTTMKEALQGEPADSNELIERVSNSAVALRQRHNQFKVRMP